MNNPRTSRTMSLGTGRVPLPTILVYSLGVALSSWSVGVNTLTLPIFNIELGVDTASLSTIMAVIQLITASVDPLIANWSDNLKSRFGRRRPFVLVGGLFGAAMFVIFWLFPHGESKSFYIAWYATLLLLFHLGMSAFGTGYYALGVELPSNYDERTRIMAIRSYFQKVSQAINPWLYPIIQLAMFGGALNGVRWVGAVLGAAMVFCVLMVTVFTPERFADVNAKLGAQKLNLLTAVKETMQNKYFWILVSCGIALGGSLALFDSLALYINIYYVYGGDKAAGAQIHAIANTLALVLGIASVQFIWWLCDRLGKHIAVRLALGWMLIGAVLKFWLYSPQHPYLQLVLPFFYSVGITSFFLVTSAMMADVIDVDELHTGRRREAMFGALGSWINKLALAGAVALSGWIIRWTGFKVELGADQDPSTFLIMRILYSFAAAFFILIALLAMMKYDLTREKSEEIRAELERRRAAKTI